MPRDLPRPAGAAGADTRDDADLRAVQRRAAAELVRVAPLALDLGRVFADAGHEIALVGGPVRDAFLGRLADLPDLDFTTSARPDETLALLKRWGDAHWDIGKEFGTIGAKRGEVVVEVTTYRADRYVPSSRKPEVAFGDDLEGDLRRRDLTINAMAVRLPDLVFVDPHGGLEDLAAQLLRTPVPPEQSFDDDPLRMVRAARFASQLGFDAAPELEAAMTAMAPRLAIVAPERSRTELEKLLLGEHPRLGLDLLVRSGIAEQVLPEVPGMKLTIDEHHRHKDVYEHSLTVLEQAIGHEARYTGGPDLVLRLAALMHDVGKPATRRWEADGGVSFHHHELVGAKMTAKRLKALRFDKDTTKQVARLVELHLRFHGYGDGAWTDSAVRRYVTDAGPLLPRLHALTRADCTTRNKRRAAKLSDAYDDLEARIAELQEKEELAAVRPELDGREIIALLGVAPGPVVGRAYQHLLQVRLDAGVIGREHAERELLTWWSQQPESAGPPSASEPGAAPGA